VPGSRTNSVGVPLRTDDVDEGAVDIKLKVTYAGRGHEVLDAHRILAWGCGFGHGEVELLFKLKYMISG